MDGSTTELFKENVSPVKTLEYYYYYIHLHQVSVNNILLGQQPVFYLFLVHGGHQVEMAQVLTEEAMHHRHILLGHWPQTLSLRSLKGEKTGEEKINGEEEPCRLKFFG